MRPSLSPSFRRCVVSGKSLSLSASSVKPKRSAGAFHHANTSRGPEVQGNEPAPAPRTRVLIRKRNRTTSNHSTVGTANGGREATEGALRSLGTWLRKDFLE